MQSIDSTVTEINRLRDQHLYLKLVQIVEKMEEMWSNMREQHEQQSTAVQRLINNNIKISQLPNNTTDNNSKNMERIHLQVTKWCSEFENLILHQKEYIKSLNNLLKLNLNSVHNNLKPQNPKITSLLSTWNDQIEKLSEARAKTAINSLASAIASGEMDDVDVIADQQAVVDALKRRQVDAEEVHRRYGVQVIEKSVAEMTAALTEALAAMTEYAGGCLNMYGSLKSH